MAAHPHAASMLLYAQDAAETERPWERWEYKSRINGEWSIFDFKQHPLWDPSTEYRRKPRTIRIGEYDVPEPMREAPPIGTKYYFPCSSFTHLTDYRKWDDWELDLTLMGCGFCHTTNEAALLHARALISLTAKEGEK